MEFHTRLVGGENRSICYGDAVGCEHQTLQTFVLSADDFTSTAQNLLQHDTKTMPYDKLKRDDFSTSRLDLVCTAVCWTDGRSIRSVTCLSNGAFYKSAGLRVFVSLFLMFVINVFDQRIIVLTIVYVISSTDRKTEWIICDCYGLDMSEDLFRENTVMDFPKGGSGELMAALARGVAKHEGFSVNISAYVNKVIVKDGKTVRVKLAKSGRIIRAKESVINNAYITITYKFVPKGVHEGFDKEHEYSLGAKNNPPRMVWCHTTNPSCISILG